MLERQDARYLLGNVLSLVTLILLIADPPKAMFNIS